LPSLPVSHIFRWDRNLNLGDIQLDIPVQVLIYTLFRVKRFFTRDVFC